MEFIYSTGLSHLCYHCGIYAFHRGFLYPIAFSKQKSGREAKGLINSHEMSEVLHWGVVVISEMEADSWTTVLDSMTRALFTPVGLFSVSLNVHFLSRLTSLSYLTPYSANCPSLSPHGPVQLPVSHFPPKGTLLGSEWEMEVRLQLVAENILSTLLSVFSCYSSPSTHLGSGEEEVSYPSMHFGEGTRPGQLSPSSQPWDLPDNWKHTHPAVQG